MSKIRSTVWPLDAHTAAKHAILRRYLQAWIPIMSRWNGHVLYIDGFAGPGVYERGEVGSPIIALQSAMEQVNHIHGEMHFLFIEADPDRCARLKEEVAKLSLPSKLKAQIECAKFEATVAEILDDMDAKGQQLVPTFAFIDPFGFSHASMKLIARLMKHPRCEVLITFMYEEINRFLAHPDHENTFNELFGTPRWGGCAQQTEPAVRERCIQDLYHHQLQSAAGVQFVRAFKMRNRGNRTDYFLFFGTKGIPGLAKMKEAMWRVDEGSGFEFSDATNPDQAVLFDPAPDFGDLQRRIRTSLAGKTMTIEGVEQFVLVDTPYHAGHYKRVLRSMEAGTPAELVVREAKRGRKRGQFPDGTVLEFS